MKATVSRWGNSLAVRIPRTIASELDLRDGASVEVLVSDGQMVVRPSARRYGLDEVVAGITSENRHGETLWGPAAGREIW